ncbi:MAG: hypothetical protein R3C32_07440 [Chloroflexota bacterium]
MWNPDVRVGVALGLCAGRHQTCGLVTLAERHQAVFAMEGVGRGHHDLLGGELGRHIGLGEVGLVLEYEAEHQQHDGEHDATGTEDETRVLRFIVVR